ncbi:hypothetical protein O0549_05500, partial [Lactobacillus delbrueckii subsp. sunkii]|nr:hypothetical protein [Lactobacillus delbrueckii subsp. sunkii]
MSQSKMSIEKLYCVAYGLYVAGMICGQTLLPISSTIRHFTIGLGCGLLVMKMMIDLIEHSKLSYLRIAVYLSFLLILSLAFVSVRSNSEYELLGSVIFIFGAYDVNYKSILKTFIWVTTSILAIMLVAYLLGAIGDGTIQRT